jgi:Ca2+-binding RTX toxin-like protein
MLPVALGAATLIILLKAAPLAAKPITGTPNGDVLTGTPWPDSIRGLAGRDSITGGKGDDWLFGGEDSDTFRWANGDGHDRINGGAHEDFLFDQLIIEAGANLRLHFDALGKGPAVTPKGRLQVISLKNVEQIIISGTLSGASADDRLVLSSDPDVAPRGMQIMTGNGNDLIWIRSGGASAEPGSGDDKIGFDKSAQSSVVYDDEHASIDGHDTIFGFGKDERFILRGFFSSEGRPGALDTSGDGWVDAADAPVTVTNGSMTVDLGPALGYQAGSPGGPRVTLVGRVRFHIDQVTFIPVE